MAMDKVNQEQSKLLNAIEHWLGGLQELRRYTAYGRLARQMQKASGDYVKANSKIINIKQFLRLSMVWVTLYLK